MKDRLYTTHIRTSGSDVVSCGNSISSAGEADHHVVADPRPACLSAAIIVLSVPSDGLASRANSGLGLSVSKCRAGPRRQTRSCRGLQLRVNLEHLSQDCVKWLLRRTQTRLEALSHASERSLNCDVNQLGSRDRNNKRKKVHEGLDRNHLMNQCQH